MRVGVLALQGAVSEHVSCLRKAMEKIGVPAGEREIDEVRVKPDLEGLEAIVLPGGESTTLSLLMEEEGLFEAISAVPKIFGTCAGAILLAKEIVGAKNGQKSLGLMDISIVRNAYGRQLDSFEEGIGITLDGKEGEINAVFIRAPVIGKVGEGVEVLASCRGEPVAVRQGKYIAATFHPELSGDTLLHEYFLRL
jgi:pyridoxal 5'-phosphate synthase pdxT subunit